MFDDCFQFFGSDFIRVKFKSAPLFSGDDCFFCIGTTHKDTPDKNEYRRIEYDMPVQLANIAKFNSISTQNNFKSHRANLLFNIIQNNNPFPGGAIGFNLAQIKELVEFDFTDNSNLINYSDNLWKDYLSRADFSITKWMTLIDLNIRLPELLLMRMDKLVMQSGVEARVPFLDHKLVEYVLTIPEEILVNTSSTKPLLKKVARSHIPDQIIDRKKQGFRAPIGEWIKKDEDYFYESIKEFNSLVNLFSERELKKVLQGNDFQKKWYLVNLSRWHMTRVAN